MRFHLVHLQPHFLRCDYTFCLRGSTFYLSFQLMFWNFCLNWSISKRQGFDLSRHDLALLSPRRELATSLNGSSDNWCWPIDDLMDWGTLLVPSVSFRLILLYFCDEYGPFKVRYCFSCWTHVCCSSFRQQQNTGKQQIICSMPLNYTIKVSGGSKKDFFRLWLYLSNMAYTSDEGWWMVHMMVRPEAAMARRWSDAIKLCAMNESRPEVGSSANSNGGLVRTWKFKEQLCTRLCLLYGSPSSPSRTQLVHQVIFSSFRTQPGPHEMFNWPSFLI